MSVSDKKYWSQRVQELANSVKPVSDTDFFSSDAYREFTENAAKDMISGVCALSDIRFLKRKNPSALMN